MSTRASPASGTAAPVVPATPSRLAAWLERRGERLNPLVVKEVRQGLRTRIFWVCFGLMLLACLSLSLVAYVETRDAAYARHGRSYFFAYFVCLAVAHFFVIPYSAYRSLAREREDETWVLLVLTGLGPRRILRGKVASFLVQAGLYASAVGPFLLFSYFLNGIDLPSILGVLVLGGAWLVFLTVASVCAATLADGRIGRAAVHFVLLGALGLALIQALVAAYAMSEGVNRQLRDMDVLSAVGVFLWLMLTDGWLLFEAAASRLSLPTEDYTRGPRRALVAQVLLTLLVVLGLWWWQGRERVIPTVAGMLGGVHLAFVGLFTVSDVDGQARPLRAGTRPWSLLRPGALRGFRLMVLLLVGWAVSCVTMLMASTDTRWDTAAAAMGMTSIAAYAVIFYSVALLLGRMPRSDRLASPVSVRLLFVAAVGLASAVPPLLAALMDLQADDGLMNLLNPLVGVVNFSTHSYVDSEDKMSPGLLLCVVLVAVLAMFAADRVLAERERRAHGS